MKILVIGETCYDIFIYGDVNRLSPEAPVPVFIPKRHIENPGMSGNVATNMRSLSKKSIIGTIRQDCVVTKTRYVDDKSNHMFMRIDEGEENIRPLQIQNHDFSGYDIVVVSDYNKGFLTNDHIIEIGSTSTGLSVLDSKRILTEDILNSYTFIKVNEEEYLKNKELIDNHKWNVIITLGKKGVMYMDEKFPSPAPKETIDVSGAGDTFTASFAIKYHETNDVSESIKFANEMSAIVVSKRGVVTPL